MAKAVNTAALKRVGVDAVTLVDEFSENLLEEVLPLELSLFLFLSLTPSHIHTPHPSAVSVLSGAAICFVSTRTHF